MKNRRRRIIKEDNEDWFEENRYTERNYSKGIIR